MTSEDIRSELERRPFAPFRLHLVSGKTIDVPLEEAPWMLQNAVMVFQNLHSHARYDVVASRNIERLEQLPAETAGEPHES